MNDSGKIAPTAHYTAYAWHVLGLPHADLFVTALGARLFRAYHLLELPSVARGRPSRLLRTLRNRHLLIDRELERLRPDVVVEIGAGLSRRGVTFAGEHGVRYLELDLPEMVALKTRLVRERAAAPLLATLAERFRIASVDIMADDFAQLLARELAGAERPVVVAEGVVGYFEAAQRRKLLRAVDGALKGRGVLLADLRMKKRGNQLATRLLRLGILIATRGRGASDSFASQDEIRRMFLDAGFAEVEPLEDLESDVLSGVWRASAST